MKKYLLDCWRNLALVDSPANTQLLVALFNTDLKSKSSSCRVHNATTHDAQCGITAPLVSVVKHVVNIPSEMGIHSEHCAWKEISLPFLYSLLNSSRAPPVYPQPLYALTRFDSHNQTNTNYTAYAISTTQEDIMPSTLPIYRFPVSLQTYKTTPVDPLSIDNDECVICYRKYNEKDDERDEAEITCRPLRLQCNHIFGSECLKAMTGRGISNCSYCAKPIVLEGSSVHSILTWLADTAWVKWAMAGAREAGRVLAYPETDDFNPMNALHRPQHEEALNQLDQKLFAQELTVPEAANMWVQYLKLYWLSLLPWLVLVIILHSVWIVLDLLFPPYIELCLVPKDGLHTLLGYEFLITQMHALSWTLFWITRSHYHLASTLTIEFAMYFSIWRILTLWIGLKWLLVAGMASSLPVALFLAALISYGIKKQKRD